MLSPNKIVVSIIIVFAMQRTGGNEKRRLSNGKNAVAIWQLKFRDAYFFKKAYFNYKANYENRIITDAQYLFFTIP